MIYVGSSETCGCLYNVCQPLGSSEEKPSSEWVRSTQGTAVGGAAVRVHHAAVQNRKHTQDRQDTLIDKGRVHVFVLWLCDGCGRFTGILHV